MTVLEFIEKHPWLCVFALMVLLYGIEDIVKAWRQK